jgi:hypothetical protein
MFVERDRRYFRRYQLKFKARTKLAATLPLVSDTDNWTILDALQRAAKNGKSKGSQANGDTIDLIKVSHLAAEKLVVLLFHRASPNAADPAYRKRVKENLTLRKTKKETDEEQAVSCHLVISTTLKDGSYRAALEEIPGLSASAIMSIIGIVLRDYKYPYVKNKKSFETDTVFKAEGVKSETLDQALKKKGALTSLTLVLNTSPNIPDASGIAEPQAERVRYKIVGNPRSEKWRNKFKEFVEGTRADWDQVNVEIQLEDERRRTVRLETETEASEILFVRSELVIISDDLEICTMEVVPSVINAARKLINKA